MRDTEIAGRLLDWYDAHARVLPWRVGPAERARGIRPDPYAVWLSEVMLQQTTVAVVKDYFRRFTARWPTVADLAASPDETVMAEWAGLGYYARARNLLRCARDIGMLHGGRFPACREELQRLPGIGPYTAAAIAAIAFDHPETVVDGNVERVMARLFAVAEPMPEAKPNLAGLARTVTPRVRAGDYAQAAMDLGATVCTPRSPRCGECPLSEACLARLKGLQAELPRRIPRRAKPVRTGIAYVARRQDGAWLLERRPGAGLLGGMLGWPVTDWLEQVVPPEAPPLAADWHDPGMEVRHTFTHFHLRLALRTAIAANETTPSRGAFVPASEFRVGDLPSLMRKVHAAAAVTLRAD